MKTEQRLYFCKLQTNDFSILSFIFETKPDSCAHFNQKRVQNRCILSINIDYHHNVLLILSIVHLLLRCCCNLKGL